MSHFAFIYICYAPTVWLSMEYSIFCLWDFFSFCLFCCEINTRYGFKNLASSYLYIFLSLNGWYRYAYPCVKGFNTLVLWRYLYESAFDKHIVDIMIFPHEIYTVAVTKGKIFVFKIRFVQCVYTNSKTLVVLPSYIRVNLKPNRGCTYVTLLHSIETALTECYELCLWEIRNLYEFFFQAS